MTFDMNEDNIGYRCFICWDDIDFNDTSTKIVSACNCISTDFKYTHKDCLNLWINQNKHVGLKCQVCGSPFHVKKVLKPFKRIYKENWKVMNCLFFTIMLINTLLWMICVEYSKQSDIINASHYNEISELESLNRYDEWIVNYDERESSFEDHLSRVNLGFILQNVYFNIVTLFVILNIGLISVYFYHEKEKFIEYSIDDAYEYHTSFYCKLLKKKKNYNNDPLVDSNDRKSNMNNYKYQKIRII